MNDRMLLGFPVERVRSLNEGDLRRSGRWVLYWMIAARRARSNFALERAVAWAEALGKPLVVLEALRCDYPHASDRFHRFVLDGMRDNAAAFAGTGVRYHPYLELSKGAGRGLLAALAEDACGVVTDDSPAFFLPRMITAAGASLKVRLEAVDGNGLLPLSVTERDFPTAHGFRRHLQKTLRPYLGSLPRKNPLARRRLVPAPPLPRRVRERWPAATAEQLEGTPADLARLPIDHTVAPVALVGGHTVAARRLRDFVSAGLGSYLEDRNHPDLEGGSGLSPYLHFGHLGAHEVFEAVVRSEAWEPSRLAPKAHGKRSGWWGMSPPAEAFLDQLITWREVGLNTARRRSDHRDYASLPGWARTTLEEHAGDRRHPVYDRAALETARTHDEVWNAAQRELLREGRMHNYLRMLWGKKILEWTPDPQTALELMLELNDRHALDGRDPNSISGIFWCLGRYDRAWGPERPIFGKIRYMSSENTVRKLHLRGYLGRFGPMI